jgi:predicted  nucleic acid-binding Zn-ribbon protein
MDLRQEVSRIEDCVDEAKNAMQSAPQVPQALRDAIEQLHQQARAAKKDGTGNEEALRSTIVQLEQLADRAMAACRSAGAVDAPLQAAVQKAHQQLSQLKHRVAADSAA